MYFSHDALVIHIIDEVEYIIYNYIYTDDHTEEVTISSRDTDLSLNKERRPDTQQDSGDDFVGASTKDEGKKSTKKQT